MVDMGLGMAEKRFQLPYEEELDPRRLEEEVVNPNVVGNEEDVMHDVEMEDENHVVIVGLDAPQNEHGNGFVNVGVAAKDFEGDEA